MQGVPEGFQLDEPAPAGVPEGFQLDSPEQQAPQQGNVVSRALGEFAEQRAFPGPLGSLVQGVARAGEAIAEDPFQALVVDVATAPTRAFGGFAGASEELALGNFKEAGSQAIEGLTAAGETALLVGGPLTSSAGRSATGALSAATARPVAKATAQQFIDDAALAGVSPTTAAAFPQTAGRVLKPISENALAGATVRSGADKTLKQLDEAVTRTADEFSPGAGPVDAGAKAREGAERFNTRSMITPDEATVIREPSRFSSFRDKSEALYSRAYSGFDANAVARTPATSVSLRQVTGRFSSEELGDLFSLPVAQRLNKILQENAKRTSVGEKGVRRAAERQASAPGRAAEAEQLAAEIRQRLPQLSKQEARDRANFELQQGLREAGSAGQVSQSRSAFSESRRAKLRFERTAKELDETSAEFRGLAGEPALATDGTGLVTIADLRALRTEIRDIQNKGKFIRTPDDAALARLEGALTQDIYAAVEAQGGKSALQSLKRADKFYRLGVTRIRTALEPFLKEKATDETAFGAIVRASKGQGKGDIVRLRALRRSLKPDEMDDVSAGVLREMGRAKEGAEFSPEVFARNWQTMSDDAKAALFNRAQRPEVRENLNALARVIERQAGVERLSNRSQSGVSVQNVGTLVAFGASPVTTTSAILGSNTMGALMMNPSFTRMLVKLQTEAPKLAQSTAASAADRARIMGAIAAAESSDEALKPFLREIRESIEANDNAIPEASPARQEAQLPPG